MEENNEEIFDMVETQPEDLEIEEEVEFGDFSDTIKFDVTLKEEDKDRVFEIEGVDRKRPITRDINGAPIPMITSQDGQKQYYQSKLVLTFKDTNYAAIIPNIKWFKSTKEVDGKLITVLNPWFNTKIKESKLNDNLTSEISKTFYRYCKKKGLDTEKTTQKSFFEGLKGMKVKLEEKSGEYKGNAWSKLQIASFE